MKKLFMLITVVLSLLAPAVAVNAKTVSKDLIDRGAGTAYILYDNTNGLPTSEANSIAQTRDGFIWIGSYSGLIRYDGNQFERFDASTGIASVVCLYVDSKNRLWIGTNDNGLALYDKGNFKFFGKQDGLMSLSVRDIVEEGSGDIIVATTHGMAYVSEDLKLHAIDDSQINTENIKQIEVGPSDVIYGATYNGAIFTLENKKVTAFVNKNGMEDDTISCICPDMDHPGKAYIGTISDFVWYGDVTTGLSDAVKYSTGELRDIRNLYMEKGRIWIMAYNGIGWMESDHVVRKMKNIPLDTSVDGMIIDSEDNKWFVSSRQGVMKVVSNQFSDISALAGLEPMVVNSTCLIGDRLFLGTDTGLTVLDGKYNVVHDEKMKKLEELVKGVRIRCLMRDGSGNLWISTYDGKTGLICYTGSSEIKQYTDKEGLLSDWVRSTVELSDGTIAVSASGGINLIRDGKVTGKYDSSDGIRNSEILTICEGPNGELYLGSDGDGIYVVADNKVTHIGVSDGLPSEVVLRMRYDEKRKLLWIITSSSLAMLKNGTPIRINKFPYSNNFDMVEDDKGDIWVLSSNGLYEVAGDKLEKNGDFEYQHYDWESGLPHVPTANSWSELTDDGTLYIAGSTGAAVVNINEIEDEAQNISLTVPYVDADDERIYLEDNNVTIPKGCQRLVINGFAPSYSLKNPIISYKLDGFDSEETVTTKKDLLPVTYTNLSGGFYRFSMNVINPITGESERTITIGIEKDRRWYEEISFYIVVGIILIILVVVVSRFIGAKRVARAERKTREIREFVDQTISAFAKLIDAKDKYTQGHSRRVARYTEKLAVKLGFDEEEVRKYKNIALLHDIGKVAIPDSILNKPQGLTDDEYEIMKSHTARGKDILDEIKADPDLALGAGYHHERFDGRGYPEGLHGGEIPPVAQLIAVADTFDAMYSTRPYRKQLPLSVVVEELRSIAGTQLNEEYVNAFLELAEAGELVDLDEAKRREESNKEGE